jgi:hypothetical protein
MRSDLPALSLLSAMITPAVLISACGALVFSTSSRLARIVDRARKLSQLVEDLAAGRIPDFVAERRAHVDAQLALQAMRVRLIQNAMASLYLALAAFVGTTIAIGLAFLASSVAWIPTALGFAGTLVLFFACLLLIRESRLAVQAIKSEMAFARRMQGLYEAKSTARASQRSEDAASQSSIDSRQSTAEGRK